MHTRACTRAYLDSLWPTSAQVRLHSPLTHPTASLTPRPQVAMPLGPASHFDPFPRASTAVPMMMGGGGSGSSVGGGMGGAWSACELHPPQTSPVVTMPYTALGHQMRRSASSSAMTLSITAPSLSTPMVRPPSAVGEVRDVDRTHQPWAACDPRAHQPWVPCDPRAHQPWAPSDPCLAGRAFSDIPLPDYTYWGLPYADLPPWPDWLAFTSSAENAWETKLDQMIWVGSPTNPLRSSFA